MQAFIFKGKTMKLSTKIGRFSILGALSLTLLAACAQVSNTVDPSQLSMDVAGLELQDKFLPTHVYTRPGAPGLEQYTKFIMEPIAINNTSDNIKEVSMQDMLEMQGYLEEVMARELTASGYELVTEPSADAMVIGFTIADMKIPTAATNVSLLVVPGLSTSVGEVTIEATFADSLTEQVNAVVLESSRGSYMFNGNPLSTTSDVKTAFDNWAVGFTNALNVAHGKVAAE